MTLSALRSTLRMSRWVIFAILVVAYITAFFQRMAPATVATNVMNDLGTKEGLMGMLSAAYFYPHALMQIPAGILADRWGAKRTIGAFFVIASFGSILFAWSGSLTSASLGRFLVGAGMAMLFVPALKIFSTWFQGREFAFATGLFVSAGGLGSLLATTPLAVLTEQLGWRSSFLYAGLFTLFIAIMVFAFVSDRPPRSETVRSETDVNAETDIGLWRSIVFVVKQPAFWPLATWFFFGNGLFFTFAGLWAGPYLEEVYRLNKMDAGNVLSMVAVGIIIGGAFLSTLSNRVFHARKPVLILSAAVVASLFGALAALPGSLPISAVFAICLLFGIFGNGVVAIGFTMTKEAFPSRLSGTALGMVNVCGFLGPGLLQPAIGYLLEGYSGPAEHRYGYVFFAMLVCSGITLAVSVLAKERTDELKSGGVVRLS